MTRWVIVTEGGDGIHVVGPNRFRESAPHTYANSEKARKDADAIEPDYDQVHVLPILPVSSS